MELEGPEFCGGGGPFGKTFWPALSPRTNMLGSMICRRGYIRTGWPNSVGTIAVVD
jgi:hypothetical protein